MSPTRVTQPSLDRVVSGCSIAGMPARAARLWPVGHSVRLSIATRGAASHPENVALPMGAALRSRTLLTVATIIVIGLAAWAFLGRPQRDGANPVRDALVSILPNEKITLVLGQNRLRLPRGYVREVELAAAADPQQMTQRVFVAESASLSFSWPDLGYLDDVQMSALNTRSSAVIRMYANTRSADAVAGVRSSSWRERIPSGATRTVRSDLGLIEYFKDGQEWRSFTYVSDEPVGRQPPRFSVQCTAWPGTPTPIRCRGAVDLPAEDVNGMLYLPATLLPHWMDLHTKMAARMREFRETGQ